MLLADLLPWEKVTLTDSCKIDLPSELDVYTYNVRTEQLNRPSKKVRGGKIG
jgi:hypothetical protein